MGDSYRIVSFAADPERDTAARQAALARTLHANPRAWYFLTGAGVQRVAADLHARPGLVWLIDSSRHLRGEYDLSDTSDEDALVATLGLLVNNY